MEPLEAPPELTREEKRLIDIGNEQYELMRTRNKHLADMRAIDDQLAKLRRESLTLKAK